MSQNVVSRLNNPQFFSSSWMKTHDRDFLAHGTAVLGFAMAFASAGAYDTDELDLLHRSTLWLLVFGLLIGQMLVSAKLFSGFFGNTTAARWGEALATIFLTNAAITLELHLLKATPLLPKQPDPLLEFYFFCLPMVLSVGGFVLVYRARLFNRKTALLSACQPGPQMKRVSEKTLEEQAERSLAKPSIQDWPSAPVHTVHAQDHYLLLTMADGEKLVRGRMKDALKKLKGAHGVQVHRSWWVACDQIFEVRKSGRDCQVLLKDGRLIPVARGRRQSLREAGW